MNIIYVDDEMPALENFRLTTEGLKEIESLKLFSTGDEALDWAAHNRVDVAFLDMEMPGIHGLDLAKKLKQEDVNIKIVFVTAHSGFAFDAFRVDAIGYLLKPYSRDEVQNELNKASRKRPVPKKRVEIKTIPSLNIYVDGVHFHIRNNKSKELLALLIDRAGDPITSGEVISCL